MQRIEPNGIVGTWVSKETDSELLVQVFDGGGNYWSMNVDIVGSADVQGADLGTYTHDASTGAVSIQTMLDRNGDAGLSKFTGVPTLFLRVDGELLTLDVDEDSNGNIDSATVYNRL